MLNIKRVFAMGKQLILIEFDIEISPSHLQHILYIKDQLKNQLRKHKVEILHTYTAISIRFINSYKLDLDAYVVMIKSLLSSLKSSHKAEEVLNTIHKIPVYYDTEMALDLEFLSQELAIPKDTIIKLHSNASYTIYFHGFLPGFLYLEGLNKQLHFPRKRTPRLSIPSGSVGIGGSQTGVYPDESPGGWQIIGRSPIQWFDVSKNPPSPYKAGEQLQFYPITKNEFYSIQQEVKQNKYKPQFVQND